MNSTPSIESLPVARYAFPGPLRDRLVTAILAGEKTATSSLGVEYRREREPLPRVGDLEAVVDSAGARVAVTRVVDVHVCRLADVTDEHAQYEGEGHADAMGWRAEHELFWSSAEFRAALGAPHLTIDDDTAVVCVTFVLDHGPMAR
ncbi:ASCH domain-containing protein [Tersicoccus sp. MR15.9]|uniref:ASCH domain-containing protein n=1 Tax=Tersicoccus mangrovi TaxID=3121635 RepID=UPI002FE5AA50